MTRPRYSAPLTRAEESEFVPFAHELIGIAFATIRRYFLSGTEVVTKADASPVTLADRQAEEALRALIERRYPDHGIVGEEHGTKAGSRYRWVLDPVDGTRAFITHCFLFGTLIALERDDGAGYRPVMGVIAHSAPGLALIGLRDRCTLVLDRRFGTTGVVCVPATASPMRRCWPRRTGRPASSAAQGMSIASSRLSSAHASTGRGETASGTLRWPRAVPT